jgi:hypothetical protein
MSVVGGMLALALVVSKRRSCSRHCFVDSPDQSRKNPSPRLGETSTATTQVAKLCCLRYPGSHVPESSGYNMILLLLCLCGHKWHCRHNASG